MSTFMPKAETVERKWYILDSPLSKDKCWRVVEILERQK